MKRAVDLLKRSVLTYGLMGVPFCLASELTVPNQFSSGDVTSASDVNANFAAIEAAVNDNHARIQEGLQSQSRPVFVGFSTEQVQGDSGFNSWQQACHNTSAGSHVCTDVELSAAPYNPQAPIPEGTAWINVEIVEVDYRNSSASGYYNPRSKIQGCNTSKTSYMIQNGRVESGGNCSGLMQVACCK